MLQNFNITIVAKYTPEFKDLKKKLEIFFNTNIEIMGNFSSFILKRNTMQVLIVGPEIKSKLVFLKASPKLSQTEFLKIYVLKPKNYEKFRSIENVNILEYPIVITELFLGISKFLDKKINHTGSSQAKFDYRSDQSIIINIKSKKKIKLTELENKFLSYMISIKEPVSKSEILLRVWSHHKELDTHTLQSLIYRLRNKIERDPKKPKFLITVGKKYFLDCVNMF